MNRESAILQPTSRFSNRAENYMNYRPSYPPELMTFLGEEMDLPKTACVADIGSGTGLFAELFLRQGYTVVCIEPNGEMRKAAEKKLAHYPGYISRPGQAEQTGLEAGSVDLISVAQAFHWVDPVMAKTEFHRVLKHGGHIVLAWTIRQTHTAFLAGYDLLKQQFRLEPTRELIHEEAIRSFFHPDGFAVKSFPHTSWLDFDGLKGLLLSSSGIPLPGHVSYDTMISALVQLFVAYNKNGFVLMEYESWLYYNK